MSQCIPFATVNTFAVSALALGCWLQMAFVAQVDTQVIMLESITLVVSTNKVL